MQTTTFLRRNKGHGHKSCVENGYNLEHDKKRLKPWISKVVGESRNKQGWEEQSWINKTTLGRKPLDQ